MNEDVVIGKLLEFKGRVKEKLGKVTNNDLGEIEGRGEKLLGLLRKQYGYIRDKAELEYNDSAQLARIVSSIRKTRAEKTDIMAIAYIARYGQPLLTRNQESQTATKDENHRYDADRYSNSRYRRAAHLALHS